MLWNCACVRLLSLAKSYTPPPPFSSTLLRQQTYILHTLKLFNFNIHKYYNKRVLGCKLYIKYEHLHKSHTPIFPTLHLTIARDGSAGKMCMCGKANVKLMNRKSCTFVRCSFLNRTEKNLFLRMMKAHFILFLMKIAKKYGKLGHTPLKSTFMVKILI